MLRRFCCRGAVLCCLAGLMRVSAANAGQSEARGAAEARHPTSIELVALQEESERPKPRPEKKGPPPKKPPAQQREDKSGKSRDQLPGAFHLPPHVTLSEAQQKQMQVLAADYAPRWKKIDEARKGVLTDEQRAAQQEARDKARAAGLRGREAEEQIAASISLSADQKARLAELDQQKKQLDVEIHERLAKLLTAEQKAQLGGKFREKSGSAAAPQKGPGADERARPRREKPPQDESQKGPPRDRKDKPKPPQPKGPPRGKDARKDQPGRALPEQILSELRSIRKSLEHAGKKTQ